VQDLARPRAVLPGEEHELQLLHDVHVRHVEVVLERADARHHRAELRSSAASGRMYARARTFLSTYCCPAAIALCPSCIPTCAVALSIPHAPKSGGGTPGIAPAPAPGCANAGCGAAAYDGATNCAGAAKGAACGGEDAKRW
jgi:hypothetical protein